MALYKNESAKLSDIVTYEIHTDTEQNEDGNDNSDATLQRTRSYSFTSTYRIPNWRTL